MNELTYRALVWLTYRLAATFAVGVPLVLLIWSAWRREPLVLRLLGMYWKVASLMAISLLLLTDQRPLGYAMAVVAPVLMVISLWFWVDINEELADQPLTRIIVGQVMSLPAVALYSRPGRPPRPRVPRRRGGRLERR